MKKILLFIVTLSLVFTLSACGEEMATLEKVTTIETTVTSNDAAITALETELATLKTSLTAVEAQSDASDVLIAEIQADIVTIEAALVTLTTNVATNAAAAATNATDIDANETAIAANATAIEELIASLQGQIDTLTALVFDIQPTNVAGALSLTDGTKLVVEGVVSGFNGEKNMVIQDTDGTAIVVYFSGYDGDYDFDLGDKVIIAGERATYYGLHEVKNVTSAEFVSAGNDITDFDDITVAMFTADMDKYQGHNVVLTGLIVVELDNGHGYATLKDSEGTTEVPANEIVFYLDDIPYAETLWAVGDVVDLSVIVYDVYYGDNRVVVYEYPALSDADAITYISTVFELPETTMENLDYMAMSEMFDVAMAWSSDTPAIITEYGVVTQPALGEDEASVVMTVVFSKGTETAVTKTYTVKVPAVAEAFVAVGTELFISEYIEGGSNNKAIEIFNPTAAAITMDGYKIGLYSNGKAIDATDVVYLDLSGMVIEAGGVYVIYNSGSVIDITKEGDIDSNVTYFNGDDALALLKNDVVIDVFGVIGTDPGSSWEVGEDGSTSNHTLVRASSVTGPNAVFTAAEWVVYDQDTFDYIGDHVTDVAAAE